MRNVILVVFALLFSQFAWGANTNIQNGDSNLTIRGKLNELLGQVHNVKQPPYNAFGDGSHNDHDAIQAAVNDACSDGAPVFIPAHTYQISSTITLCHGLRIIGANRIGTVLQGSFAGFILGYTDAEIGGVCCITVGIESLTVKNFSSDWASGGILFDNMNPGSYIRDCAIGGMTGIDAQWNMFTADISDCDIGSVQASGYPLQVGIYASQISISNIKIGGYETGISMNGPGGSVRGVGVETTYVGLDLGNDRPAIFTGSVSGTTLTISSWNVGHRIDFWAPIAGGNLILICPFTQPCGAAGITAQLTNTNGSGQTGKEGTYSLSANLGTITSQRMGIAFPGLQISGTTINSFQTERDNIGVYLRQAAFTQINGGTLTGTVGVGIQVDTASWSSAAGGTITYTLNYPSPGYTQGTHSCSMDGFANANYNKGYFVTCNWSGRTVTIAGTGPDPGPWVAGFATISPLQQSCIVLGRQAQNVTIANTSCGASSLTGTQLDLSNAFGSIDHLILTNSSLGAVAMATNNKAGIRIVNNPSPTWADIGLTYSQLPGTGGANPGTPVKSELYYIMDANTSTIGGNVTGGGGSTQGYVTWNGTNWTLVSK